MRSREIRVPALVSGRAPGGPSGLCASEKNVGGFLLVLPDLLVLKQTKVDYFFKLLLQRNC